MYILHNRNFFKQISGFLLKKTRISVKLTVHIFSKKIIEKVYFEKK